MRDMMGMMKKAKEMQARMQQMQDEIAALNVTATSGGGLVSVSLTGQGLISAIKIDASLFNPDETEIVEDLVMAAHNEAKRKIETLTAEKTSAITEGLPLPPGFKLPF